MSGQPSSLSQASRSTAIVTAWHLLRDIDLEDGAVVGGEDGFRVRKPRRPGAGRGFGARGGVVVVSLSW
jgi:hypothetical protein